MALAGWFPRSPRSGRLEGLDHATRERRWRVDRDQQPRRRRPHRGLVVALLLACATLATVDLNDTTDAALDPARRTLGEVYGPAQDAASTAVRPLAEVGDWFRGQASLREEVAGLEAENADLRAELRASGFNRNRLEQLEGLTTAAGELGHALVPARVVGVGPAQSFSQTVTIDAGTASGVRPDMTVLNDDGLVGRVLQAGRSTATVLLITDPESTVGARVADSMKMGFLDGRGGFGGDLGRLDLELVDDQGVPHKRDSVVTWGSKGGAPYVSGIPVGEVKAVYESLRDQTKRIEVTPYVDFGALDLVAVVVPTGTESDRAVIEADGRLR